MLITGGEIVDIDGRRKADIRMEGGKVTAVETGMEPRHDEEFYDATGQLVIPGGVDVHTHLNMPLGACRVADDFYSGTRAAAVGGTTTIVDYVTAYRGQDPMAALAKWQGWAERSVVDYGLHMMFTESVPEAQVAKCIEAGIMSFKLYMAYPALMVGDDVIADMFRIATRHGGLVTFHCENGGGIESLRHNALANGRTAVIEHALTRPPVLEAEAVTRAAALAEVTGAPLYIVHTSSADALRAVRKAHDRGVDITAETCPQYLYLDSSMLEGPEAEKYVCTPPLRDKWHQEELWEGLTKGYIQTVATDHCPFNLADKRAGTAGRPEGFADFTEIPGGLPGIETRLALIWAGVKAGRFGVQDWVRLISERPAQLFGLWPAKGNLRVGADADVVVWDPSRRQSLDASALSMRVDNSPMEGSAVTGWPSLVLSRGRVVARDGQPTGEEGWGRYVARTPRDVG